MVRAAKAPLTVAAWLCDPVAAMQGRYGFPLLLIAAVLLFFTRLDVPLLEPQEARYAEIPRQMLHSGDWLTPVLHGQSYLDKPPLLYWLVMISYSVFGVHDWAARLVPGCAGVLTVLVTYFWGRRIAGERAGLLGGMVLCLSARYVYLGRMLTFDTLLCLWVTASLAAAHIALTGGGRRWWLLCGAACGLGILTKGPVALALLAAPVLGLMLTGRTVRPRFLDVLCCVAMMFLVAGPWFVFMALRHPSFMQYFFWQHHVVRFLSPFDHEEPFWFHMPGVLLGMMPWTLLLPGLIRSVRGTPALVFPLLAAGGALLFFSLSGCKRAVYILPALPPLALALGSHLDAVRPWSSKLTVRCAGITFAWLFAAILLLLPGYNERFALRSAVLEYANSDVPIACYPRGWDSVSFYLQRGDVRIFSTEQHAAFLDALRRQSETLVFLKGGGILADLPPTLSFTLERKAGSVMIGRVRQGGIAPARIVTPRSTRSNPVK